MSLIPFRRRSSDRCVTGAPGQAIAEYAVIIAAIAVACMLAVLFLAAGIRGRFDSSDGPSQPAPFVPPRSSPAPSYPTKLEDCTDGRWRNYAQFRSELECKQWVEKHRTP